jgi:N-acetylglucosaminyldiphosphoundecaprenol N-acetyl-beta-D-mannosaminyltransferase
VFFFGGPQGAAEAAARRLNAERSALTCVGYESPGFGSVDELSREETIARINASGADLLVVSLGAKKGQAWIERNRARITVPAVTHLGAVVNFVAGSVDRAPRWMQKSGLEWLWRIKEEPVLWRRYWADGLALASLLATRIVPYAWLLLRRKPGREELGASAYRLRQTEREVVVRLRGAWVQENLAPLRQCLSQASAARKDVRIDLAHASYVDSSFLGLMLLLYGVQKANGRRLLCTPVSASVRRIFEYGCSEFLLAAEDETDAGTPAWSDLDEAELEDARTANG